MSSAPLIETLGLCKTYGAVEVLRGVDFRCRPGQVLGLVGRNGSGKSTLLACISGRAVPDSGQVILDGHTLPHEPAWQRARRGIGWTLQNPSLSLTRPVGELVALAERRGRSVHQPEYAELIAATDALLSLRWNRLSFGQRKLAALRVALARGPSVILLDEPAGGLSPAASAAVSAAIKAAGKGGAAIVVVEHDLGFLGRTADEVAVLAEGRISTVGSPHAVLAEGEDREPAA